MRKVATALSEHDLGEIQSLCQKWGVKRLRIFGSAVTERFLPGSSDFDFIVMFSQVAELRSADQYFGLKEAMERLLGSSVDLVTEKSVRNRFFQEELDEKSVELYAA